MPEPKASRPERMSEEELRRFVHGLCDGDIFTSHHLANPEEELPLVFLPLPLGLFNDWSTEEVGNVGVIWQWLREATPMSVNGLPSFFGCRVMHKDDWARAYTAYQAEQKRREEIKV